MRPPANILRSVTTALAVAAALLFGLTTTASAALYSASPAAPSTAASAHPAAATQARLATTTPAHLAYAVQAIPSCTLSSLPTEASDTLALIHSGGPFPYDQDGTVFQNREGILPSESSGYYHEYTVKTPGSPDRGARRLIGGGATTTPVHVYYTDDHYESFCEVDQEG
ncbi:ribonuclease domain-containing protein [Kribbella sp. NPDC056861]|uniref:ribonuclease domain-containing protein n=1 Tax=Kribbella sp. NPDC056861 TaxID=3154857 RepID=UPI0034298A7B